MLSNGLFNTLIGKSLSRTSGVTAGDVTASTYLANGEVVVLDKTGAALTPGQTIADSDFITIVQRSGATATTSELKRSVRIQGSSVTKFSGVSYTAPAEQISYIGYNGTTGSIDVINSNVYELRITFKYNKAIWSEQNQVNYNQYTSDSSATQSEIAAGFAKKYDAPYPSSNADIKVERVTDGTFTVAGGATTAVVTNGSKTVTFSGTGHNFVAGDIIRIGGTSSTTPVYLVASASGAVVTLDQNYQGTSGTVANANIGEMSVVTSWGLKITGKPLTFSIPSFMTYMKVAFDVTIGSFGATVVTDTQAASKGNGTYEEAAMAEYFSLGYDGFGSIRNAVPAEPVPYSDATSGAIYDVISIEGYVNDETALISGNKPAKYQILIFMVDGAAQTTNLLAQLNPWMASTPKAFNSVTV